MKSHRSMDPDERSELTENVRVSQTHLLQE